MTSNIPRCLTSLTTHVTTSTKYIFIIGRNALWEGHCTFSGFKTSNESKWIKNTKCKTCRKHLTATYIERPENRDFEKWKLYCIMGKIIKCLSDFSRKCGRPYYMQLFWFSSKTCYSNIAQLGLYVVYYSVLHPYFDINFWRKRNYGIDGS